MLTAFTSSKPLDLDNPDCLRDILTNYLSPYELKYSGYVQETSDTLNCIVTNLSEKQGLRPNIELAKSSILNNIKVLDGESQYYDFLTSSFSAEFLPQQLVKEIDGQRKQLRILNDQLIAIASYLTSVVSLRLADISVFLGGISIVLSILLTTIPQACSDEDRLNRNVKDIKKFLQISQGEIEKKDTIILQEYNDISIKQDSILHLLNKLNP